MIYFLILSTLLIVAKVQAQEMRILPLSVADCPVSGTRLIEEGGLVNINDKDKAFTSTIDFPYEFNEEFTFTLQVDKYINGFWQENIHSVDGNVCEYLLQFLPDLWKKLRAESSPPLSDEECKIKPGKYSIDKFEVNKDEVQIPAVLYGKFRLIFKLYSPNDEEVMCRIMEGESQNQ